MSTLLVKRFTFLLVLVLVIAFCSGGVLKASDTTMKDITSDPQKYSDKKLTISGKVLSPINLMQIDTKNFDMNKPNPKQSENVVEINLYLLNDGTDNIFIVTHKTLEKDSSLQFTAKLLITSNDEIDSKVAWTFHEFVNSECQVTAKDLSKILLNKLIGDLQKYKPWTLLIDAE